MSDDHPYWINVAPDRPDPIPEIPADHFRRTRRDKRQFAEAGPLSENFRPPPPRNTRAEARRIAIGLDLADEATTRLAIPRDVVDAIAAHLELEQMGHPSTPEIAGRLLARLNQWRPRR